MCRPTRAPPSARRSIAVPWRERPRDLATWSAKPAATEVVAHATLSLPQPERVVVGRVRPAGIEGVRIGVVNTGRRGAIVRLATRALKALRASLISLRPRCARLTALTARVATRSWATIDGPHGSAWRRSAAALLSDHRRCSSQPPPHRPMWSTFESAVSRPRFVPHFLNNFPVVCSCDVTSANR